MEASAQTALGLGFQGKMCIHPDQIAVVNRVFSPTDAEIAFAEQHHHLAEALGKPAARLNPSGIVEKGARRAASATAAVPQPRKPRTNA